MHALLRSCCVWLVALVALGSADVAAMHCTLSFASGFESRGAGVYIDADPCQTRVLEYPQGVADVVLPLQVIGEHPGAEVHILVGGRTALRVPTSAPSVTIRLGEGSHVVTAALVTAAGATVTAHSVEVGVLTNAAPSWELETPSGRALQPIILRASGVLFTTPAVNATLGGEGLIFSTLMGNVLVAAVPDLQPGTHQLVFTDAAMGNVSLPFEVLPPSEIIDPRGFVAQRINDAIEDLHVVESGLLTLDHATVADVRATVLVLETVRTQLGDIPPAQLMAMARMLDFAPLDDALPPVVKGVVGCDEAHRQWQWRLRKVSARALIVSMALYSAYSTGVLNPYGAAALAVAAVGVSEFWLAERPRVEADAIVFFDACAASRIDVIVGAGLGVNFAKGTVPVLNLVNGQSSEFTIGLEQTVDPTLVEAAIHDLNTALGSLVDLLPDGFELGLAAPESGVLVQRVPQGEYLLESAGGSELEFAAAANGNLTEMIAASATSPQTFELRLTHSPSAREQFLSVELTGELPEDCSIFSSALVTGRWTVTYFGDDNYTEPYGLEVHADGTGTYTPERLDHPNHGNYYPMTWRITGNSIAEGCHFMESGFFNDYGGVDTSGLQIPVTQFFTYAIPTGLARRHYEKH